MEIKEIIPFFLRAVFAIYFIIGVIDLSLRNKNTEYKPIQAPKLAVIIMALFWAWAVLDPSLYEEGFRTGIGTMSFICFFSAILPISTILKNIKK